MDRRTVVALGGLLAALGWAGALVSGLPEPLSGFASATPPFGRGGSPLAVWTGVAILILAGVAVAVLAAHQYVRWREHRPAIHLAAALVAFVVGVALWIGSPNLGNGGSTLTASERDATRIAALLLVFVLLVLGARGLEDRGGNGN